LQEGLLWKEGSFLFGEDAANDLLTMYCSSSSSSSSSFALMQKKQKIKTGSFY